MRAASYAEIEPLVVSRRVDGKSNTVACVFACPVTRRQVCAEAPIRQGEGFADRLVDSASHSFWYQLRRKVADTVCSFLPHGFVREVAEGTAWRMLYAGDDSVSTSREVDEATAAAFQSVQHEFVHDGERWVGREVDEDFASDFQRQLQSAPVATRFEAEILVRALAAMAALDGENSSERSFLATFAKGGEHSIGKLAAPTAVELSEVSADVRPTLYMLAAALALVDSQSSSGERAYLAQLERGLGVDAERSRWLRNAAGHFVIEQAIGLEAQPSAEELASLAALAGIPVEEAERVLVRRRKRQA